MKQVAVEIDHEICQYLEYTKTGKRNSKHKEECEHTNVQTGIFWELVKQKGLGLIVRSKDLRVKDKTTKVLEEHRGKAS